MNMIISDAIETACADRVRRWKSPHNGPWESKQNKAWPG